MNKAPRRTINYRTVRMVAVALCLVLLPNQPAALGAHWETDITEGAKAYEEGRYADAEKLFLTALKEAERFEPQDHRLVVALQFLARLYTTQGKYAEAEALFKRALAVQENWEKASPALMQVGSLVLNSLGELYYTQGKYPEAEAVFKQALAGYEKTQGQERPEVSTILQNLALVFKTQGKYADAESLYMRSLAIREKSLGRDHPYVATSLNNIGVLYTAQGRYAQAEQLFKRALAIEEKTLGPNHPNVAITLNNIAELYKTQERYAETVDLYVRSAAVFEKSFGPYHPLLTISLNNLGEVYLAQGKYREAEPPLKRALAIQEKTQGQEHPDVATSLVSLAMLYTTQDKLGEAERLLKRALAIEEKTLGPDHPDVATGLTLLAGVLARQQRPALARPLFERARRIELKAARVNARLHDEARQGLLSRAKRTLPLPVAWLAAIARNPTLDPNPVPAELDAFVVVEQARSGLAQMALAKATARTATRDPDAAKLARMVEDLRNRRQAINSELAGEYGKAASQSGAGRLRSLQDTLQQVDRELNQAVDRLTKAFPKYTDLSAPEPAGVEAVQRILRPDEALVSFFALDDRLLIWLIRPNKELVYRDIEIKKTLLAELISRVRLSLDQSKNPKLTAGLLEPVDVDGTHRLYKILFGPIRDHLVGVKHLIVVPDELLLPLPFGTLLTRAEGEPYKTLSALYAKRLYPDHRKLAEYGKLPWLVREMAITVLPSATSLRGLRQVRKTKRRAEAPFIGFGDPLLYGSGDGRGGEVLETRGTSVPPDKLRKLPRLPGTRQELLAVAKVLGADPGKAVYLGENATEPMVSSLNASGRLGKSEVVAFATHALIAGQVVGLKQPALVLTPPDKPSEQDDGLLDLEDILRLKLDNTDWVILSACNTGLEKGASEGLSGLVRAFFFAGTPSLLVSHWSVADQPTQALMTEVFQRYARDKTMPRSEALRQGMLALTAKAKGATAYFAHPFAWAPFFLVGEGSSPLN